jgi:hypothetical protein
MGAGRRDFLMRSHEVIAVMIGLMFVSETCIHHSTVELT